MFMYCWVDIGFGLDQRLFWEIPGYQVRVFLRGAFVLFMALRGGT